MDVLNLESLEKPPPPDVILVITLLLIVHLNIMVKSFPESGIDVPFRDVFLNNADLKARFGQLRRQADTKIFLLRIGVDIAGNGEHQRFTVPVDVALRIMNMHKKKALIEAEADVESTSRTTTPLSKKEKADKEKVDKEYKRQKKNADRFKSMLLDIGGYMDALDEAFLQIKRLKKQVAEQKEIIDNIGDVKGFVKMELRNNLNDISEIVNAEVLNGSKRNKPTK